MKKVTLKLIDPMGIHARPIAAAVNKLREFDCEGYIFHDGRQMDMTSVVKLIEMEIPTGSTFILGTEGEQEDEASYAVVDVLKEIGFAE